MSRTDTLQILLREVRRRLLLERSCRAAEIGLWATAALCLLALAVHLWLYQLHAPPVIGSLSFVWFVLLAWSLARPASTERCADWADRHLGGQSAFSTALEMETASSPSNTGALAHLHHRLGERIEEARRTLRATPFRLRARRPAVIALATVALLTVVLQMPGREAAPARGDVAMRGADVPPELTLSDEPGDTGTAKALLAEMRQDEERQTGSASLGHSQAGAVQPEKSVDLPVAELPMTAGPAPATAESLADRERMSAPATASGSTTDSRTSGREAGTAPGNGATEHIAEPGATVLASDADSRIQLERGTDDKRADSSQAGVYLTADVGPGAPTGERAPAFPAADPPQSQPTQELGPVAAAYVAAYLESRTGQ